MTRRGALRRRSPAEWAGRGALALSVTVLGGFSVAFSLGQLVVKSDPVRAHRLVPYDGRITAAAAMALAGPDSTLADRRRANTLALQALRQDPTAVAAFSVLGVNAEVVGDVRGARRWFRNAQTLSRRDLQVQLWMIEDAVRRGDIPDTLRQYDITLRVIPRMWEVLFPILAAASDEPGIRVELAMVLAKSPPWGPFFVDYVAGNAPDPKIAAKLLTDLRGRGGTVPAQARAKMVNALVKSGSVEDAWTYYAAAGPTRDRRRSRDPNFAADPATASPFDWVPIDGGGLTANIQDGLFDFAVPPSVGGPMLQQMQWLPPGTYRLTGHSTGIEQAASALPYWTLRCQNGQELGRVEVPGSSVANGNFTGTFSVPAGCPTQTLVLTARPSEAISGLSGQFDRVELVPAQ
ncbi:tetratricopeptide repeat protein [Sphingomonas sp. RS2018]